MFNQNTFLVLLLSTIFATLMASRVDEIIDMVNSNKDSTWVAGRSIFLGDREPEDIKHLLGWIKNPAIQLPEKKVQVPDVLPTNFTAGVDNWTSCASMEEIYNQADCGSCWAFGGVESFIDRICLESDGANQPALSPLYLVTCDEECMGCEGGDASSTWQFMHENGLPEYACQNYSAAIPTCPHEQQPCLDFVNTPRCSQDCTSGPNATEPIPTKWYVKESYSVNGLRNAGEEMQAEIYANGPVEACFTVYEDFVSYTSGVYIPHSDKVLGGHCIRIVGWGTTADGVDYWVVRNSWTHWWGWNGSVLFGRGHNYAGIEADVVAGTVDFSRH